MKTHIQTTAFAFFSGLIGCIIIFLVGSFSGSGEAGLITAGFLFLYVSAFLSQKKPIAWWYIGLLINMPVWVLLSLSDKGQIMIYLWGLFALLAGSYAGAGIGLLLLKHKLKVTKTVLAFLIIIPVSLVFLITFLLSRPDPLPVNKILYSGLWESGSGFELTIQQNGEALIKQDNNDKGSDYENLNITVAPPYITKLLVAFRGDSVLVVSRQGYYAKEYKINKSPYIENNQYKLVLNGITLVKKKSNKIN